MKKIFAMLLMISVLLTGTVVFAEEETTSAASDSSVRTKISEKINEFKNFKAELQPQIDEIKANRQELIQLRQEATASYKELKNQVKDLLKGKVELTQEQVEALQQAVDILVADKKLLAETAGDIFKESVNLRLAKRQRDLDASKAALDEIISIQEKRMESLNKVIDDIKAIELI